MAQSFWQSLSRASYFGGAVGMTGAAAAWIGAQTITTLGPVISSYGALDLIVLALLGAAVGGLVGAGSASLRDEPVGRAAGLGLLLGAGGAAAGGLIAFLLVGAVGLRSAGGFWVTRALVWTLAGGAMGSAIAAPTASGGRTRLIRAALGGAAAGLLGAGLLSAPGPSAVWQLVAFLMMGALVGYGCLAVVPGSWVVERIQSARAVGLWQHREWEIEDGRPAVIGHQVRVESTGGQGRVGPTGAGGSPVTIGGRAVRAGTALSPGDRIRIGEVEYLVRRTGSGR